jgi:hypothetical protein
MVSARMRRTDPGSARRVALVSMVNLRMLTCSPLHTVSLNRNTSSPLWSTAHAAPHQHSAHAPKTAVNNDCTPRRAITLCIRPVLQVISEAPTRAHAHTRALSIGG